MSVVKVIGNNIKKLMDDSGTSARRLSEVIGVTHPTVLNYINGDKTIDSEKLYLVAEYFEKDIDYFFSDERRKISLMFRADKPSENLDEIDSSSIVDRIGLFIELMDEKTPKYIPQNYSISVSGSKLSDDVEHSLEKIALEQRRLFGIETSIPDNYFSVIANIGINVLCYEFRNATLFGASSFSREHGSFIVVNARDNDTYEKNITEERQIFSLVHELGHLIFHRNEYQDPNRNPFYEQTRGNMKEKTVDAFAGYFLIPREMVIRYMEEKKAESGKVSPIEMKRHFKVSIQTLYINLKKYGLIPEEKYRAFWKDVNTKGWKVKEPHQLDFSSLDHKNEKLIAYLKKLYLAEEISTNKISEVLCYDMNRTRKLINSWSNDDGFDSIL